MEGLFESGKVVKKPVIAVEKYGKRHEALPHYS